VHRPTHLHVLVAQWPTPRATDGTNGGPKQRGSKGDLMLPSAVLKTWPTPTARDWRSGSASEETHARNSRPLNEVVTRLERWPTPTASDGMGGPGTDGRQGGMNLRTAVSPRFADDNQVVETGSGRLNPRWALTLMNFPEDWLDFAYSPEKKNRRRKDC
jgi:hypothetical protein